MEQVKCCASCKYALFYGDIYSWGDCRIGIHMSTQPYQVCDKHEWADALCSHCNTWKPINTFAIISEPDTDLYLVCMDCYKEMNIII